MGETKVCTKCGEEKPATVEYFSKKQSGKFGLNSYCKLCKHEYDIEYYENTKERRARQDKKYYKNNKEKIFQRDKEYRKNNRDKISMRRKEYYKNNKKKVLDRNNEQTKRRRLEDPRYKLNKNISCAIRESILENKAGRHWEMLVDYTLDRLMDHMERQFKPGMTWENYGFYGWHIDHKRPISSFSFTSPDNPEFKECWALDNLQPLWAEDNIRKRDKWEGTTQISAAISTH